MSGMFGPPAVAVSGVSVEEARALVASAHRAFTYRAGQLRVASCTVLDGDVPGLRIEHESRELVVHAFPVSADVWVLQAWYLSLAHVAGWVPLSDADRGMRPLALSVAEATRPPRETVTVHIRRASSGTVLKLAEHPDPVPPQLTEKICELFGAAVRRYPGGPRE